MMNSRSNRFNLRTLLNLSEIDKNVQLHLKNVYGMLTIGLLSAMTGAYAFMISPLLKSYASSLLVLSFIVSIGSMMYIYFVEHKRDTIAKRSIAYLTFTTLTGLNLGPILHRVAFIDPSVIPTALLGTSVIFIAFTLASLLTKNRYYLFLGAALMSACGMLSTMSLINLFVRSPAVYSASLYIGLLIFCAFVIFDTQLMVEKRKQGDTDFIWHALDLFVDFVEIFVRLLVILTEKRNNRREE